MIDEGFFSFVNFLKYKHLQDDQHNIFSALRGKHDEVRLHSRFLCYLLDPTQNHGLKEKALTYFLEELEVDGFDITNVKVRAEYSHIDILITNSDRQAIVIENKISAGDQPKQLYRYYEKMKNEGKRDIYIIYLTLDGRDPSDDSIDGIPAEFMDSKYYNCISYSYCIAKWISKCLGAAAFSPALREDLGQYKELIEGLTGMNQSEAHIDELKKLLNKESNLASFPDLQRAYTECLIDNQFDIWCKVADIIRKKGGMGELDSNSFLKDSNPKDKVAGFHWKKRKNGCYGIFYRLPGVSAAVGVEMEEDCLYVGVRCDDPELSEDYKRLKAIGGQPFKAESSEWWPMCRYSDTDMNYKNLTHEMLVKLSSEDSREAIAEQIAQELHEIWDIVTEQLKD